MGMGMGMGAIYVKKGLRMYMEAGNILPRSLESKLKCTVL
jgi:hypothetical protein